MSSSTDEVDQESLALYDALVAVAGPSGVTALGFAEIVRAGGATGVFPGDDDGVDSDRVESVAASLIADGHVTRRGEDGWAPVRRPGDPLAAAPLSADDPDLERLEDEPLLDDESDDEPWEQTPAAAPTPARAAEPPARKAPAAKAPAAKAPSAKAPAAKAPAAKAPAKAAAGTKPAGTKPAAVTQATTKAAGPRKATSPARPAAARSTSTPEARTGSTPVSSTPRKSASSTRKAAPRRAAAGAPTADALAGPLASLLSEVDEQVSAVTELTGRIDELVTELNDARADQAARWAALAQLRKVAYDAGLGEAIDPRLAAPLPEVVEQDFPPLG